MPQIKIFIGKNVNFLIHKPKYLTDFKNDSTCRMQSNQSTYLHLNFFFYFEATNLGQPHTKIYEFLLYILDM